MKKQTSNKLILLLLALFTMGVIISLLLALNIDETLAFIIALVIAFGLYSRFLKQNKKDNPNKIKELKKVSESRKKQYQANGLSDEDIHFFRKTMNQAKHQIMQLEDNIQQVSKLRAITNRYDTLNLIKILFKDIVNEPNRLHEVDQFLYVHLPSLTELTNKYVQISQHQAKSKQTFEVLEKSAETIDTMCQQIADDYLRFRSKDIKDLDNEVKLAKKRLNRGDLNIQDDEI